jgi:hypothetical protein
MRGLEGGIGFGLVERSASPMIITTIIFDTARKNIRRVAHKSFRNNSPFTKNRLLDEQAADMGHSESQVIICFVLHLLGVYQLDVMTEYSC